MAGRKSRDNEPVGEGTAEPAARRWRTRKEVATLMGISIGHLDDLVSERGVPVMKVGRSVRFDTAAIEYLQAIFRAPRPPRVTRMVIRHLAPRADASQAAFDEVMRLTAPSRKKKKLHAGRPKRC